jgi:hypothetical protein
MAGKPTLTTQVASLTETVNALVGLVTPLVQGQHATSAPVAEAVAPVSKPVTLVKAEPVKTPSDVLKEAVEAKGLAFARGGRTVLTTEHLTAAVRVLKTGTPEILPVSNVRLEKRNVTHIAIGRDGQSVITQYVYKPEA